MSNFKTAVRMLKGVDVSLRCKDPTNPKMAIHYKGRLMRRSYDRIYIGAKRVQLADIESLTVKNPDFDAN